MWKLVKHSTPSSLHQTPPLEERGHQLSYMRQRDSGSYGNRRVGPYALVVHVILKTLVMGCGWSTAGLYSGDVTRGNP